LFRIYWQLDQGQLGEVRPQLRPPLGGKRGDIVDAWNAVLKDAPSLHHSTVEGLMARVNKIDGIDLGWRTYLRERYDV
jgi:hypothetical protein